MISLTYGIQKRWTQRNGVEWYCQGLGSKAIVEVLVKRYRLPVIGWISLGSVPGGPLVKILPSNAGGVGLTPVGKLRSHMPWGHNTKTWNRSNIVTNSVKTLKKCSPSKKKKSLKKKHIWGSNMQHWKRPWCWERLQAGGDEQTLENSEWHRNMACCSLWGLRELEMTWPLTNSKWTAGWL